MKVLDLFSGIGGFSLGLERAGMETVAFCEISPVCRHLLAHHWPDVPCFDDVTTLTGEQVGPVDVICGGFPCQDISFAGKGAGLAGERSGLWREYARLVRELRPAFVIVENVAALLGRGLGDVLGDLAALGYDAWWDCIPASAVGAPHRRDRLWIVAYARGQQHEGYGDALRREIAAGLSRAAAEQGVCAGAASSHEGRTVVNAGGGRHGAPDRTLPTGWNRPVDAGWWSAEPDVGRVAHGVPARSHRLHGLGNAVVPQIPEILGRAIIAAANPVREEIAA
ncbi:MULTISPECIES: DNA cytosine methyltransferase [Brevundimonas]|uniref:DNA cytosine methyltransferase n=1 Tax=Brevundimonas sp. UBA7507 TaxID=1946137 RepID=UPI002579D6FA|nr:MULTISPECIES: DNA cytosine methyltransferase [Brevundimonas]